MSRLHENTTARVKQWKYLNGTDFKNMDRANTVAIVSCSPMEVHGPHLPVVTDNHEAEGLSIKIMERLCEKDDSISFVHLPPIWVAADVLPHPGSVMFRTSTVRHVLEDMGRSLAAQGFRHIWVANFHGGPRHFVALEMACDKVNKRHGTRMISMFSLLINQLTGGSSDLGTIFAHIDGVDVDRLLGDNHGGAVETAMMLHLLGDHIASGYESLPRRTVDLKLEEQGLPPITTEGRPSLMDLLRGFRHKIKYYEDETYSGDPSMATAEIGAQMVDTLAEYASDALHDVWTGARSPEECRSPLWKARWLFSNQTLSWLFEKAVDYRTQVF